MYLNPSIFYSLIITISQKKCIDASVDTNLKEVKSVEAIMLLMVTYFVYFAFHMAFNVFF